MGFRDKVPGSSDYFSNSRFSNSLSMHHLVTWSFPFLGLFLPVQDLYGDFVSHHHTLNGNTKWQFMWTYKFCYKPHAHVFACQTKCCWGQINPSLHAIKTVGIKHQNNWRVPTTSVWKKKTILNKYNTFFSKINCSALAFCRENLKISIDLTCPLFQK